MKKRFITKYLMAAMFAMGALTSCGSDDTAEPDQTQDQNQTQNQDQNQDQNQNQQNQNDAAVTIPTGKVTLKDAKTPADILVAMGMGWNLGNQFDAWIDGASSETAWGQPLCTQATFDKVAASGMKTVRIPITWMGHIGSKEEGYKIEDKWMNRIYEVVGYCEKAGLNCIINIHHDGSDSKHWLNIVKCAESPMTQEETVAEIKAIWKQIAEKFKDKGHFLIMEGFNEIQDGKWGYGANTTDGGRQYRCYNEWVKAFVETVRATGGNNADRWLGIPSYCTSYTLSQHLVLPADEAKRLMVAIHYYEPSDYTLTAKFPQWGHTAAAGKTPATGQEADCRAAIKLLYERYIAKGIPVYMGEMGNVNRNEASEEAFRKYYFEYVLKCMHDSYIPAILWDNGCKGTGNEQHGYFNHGTGEWMTDYSESMVKTMVKAMTDNSKDYTLESVYIRAPKN